MNPTFTLARISLFRRVIWTIGYKTACDLWQTSRNIATSARQKFFLVSCDAPCKLRHWQTPRPDSPIQNSFAFIVTNKNSVFHQTSHSEQRKLCFLSKHSASLGISTALEVRRSRQVALFVSDRWFLKRKQTPIVWCNITSGEKLERTQFG